MRVIPTNVHGYLDYIVGILLIAAPWLLGFYEGGAETWVPVILGAGTILYSLITNYELGAAKSLSMGAHLGMDFVAGAFLAVSPWLLNYADIVYWPHLVVGILEMLLALITKTTPSYEGVPAR